MFKKKHIPFFIIFFLFATILSYELTSLFLTDNNNPVEDDNKHSIEYEDELETSLETNNSIKADTIQLSRITPSTKIVYQYYYLRDDRLVTDEYEPPYYLIDMTRQQLEDYYDDWQIVSFSTDKVILRKSIDERESEEYYIIKEYEGRITVFYDYREAFDIAFEEAVAAGRYNQNEKENCFIEFMSLHKEHYLREILDKPISVLTLEEQKSIKEGLIVYKEEELIRLLENYTS